MRGRKPLPTNIKILRGNPGKRPLPKDEPEPVKLETCPPPPKDLLPEGREEWVRVGPELCRLGLLTVADVTTFAAYCQSVAHWRRAEAWIKKHGSTVTLKNEDGSIRYIQQVPHVSISNKALDKIRAFATEFGMTPASRTRITGAVNPKDSDGTKGKAFDFTGPRSA